MSSFLPLNAVAWFEIPVANLEKSKAFYSAVLQNELRDETDGPNPMSLFVASSKPMVSGHLYPGKPAAPGSGPTIHLTAPAPLEDALERVGQYGGTVVSPIISVPTGRFAYCLDPDGNSFGLFT